MTLSRAKPSPLRISRRTRRLRVALAGCGVVGGGLLRLIRMRRERIAHLYGVHLDVVSVLVRDVGKPRIERPSADRITAGQAAFLATEADIYVEAIGGIEPALTIARHALSQGSTFVTANKALIAAHGAELAALAKQHGARLAFEAAVAGGVPVIRALREGFGAAPLRSLRGILNGTCNFVLCRIEEGGDFAEAVRHAQEAGFAEADPSRDLDGRDAADKLSVLAWLAFGADPSRLEIVRHGLNSEASRLVAGARSVNGIVRVVAECTRQEDGSLIAGVAPVVVDVTSELARVHDEQNLVIVETQDAGTYRLAGPGAGSGPTASAVLADVLAARRSPLPPAAHILSVPDTRLHRWLLLPPSGDAGALLASLDITGDVRGDAIVTAPCSAARLSAELDRTGRIDLQRIRFEG
jgi:homoserine dehydrogenase